MSLTDTRSIVAGLRRLEIPVPTEVEQTLTTLDGLVATHRQLIATIRPAGPDLPAPAVHAAQQKAAGVLYKAALTGPVVDPKVVLKAASEVAAAQADVDATARALDLIDGLTASAASNPLAHSTEPEGALIAAADDVFGAMHRRVADLVGYAERNMATLGGSLPATPAFASIATPAAVDAYRQLQHDAEAYASLRGVQRTLLGLVEGYDAVPSLWQYAEVSTGLGFDQQAPAPMPGWLATEQDQRTPDDLLPAGTPEERLRRYVHHALRHGSRLWVPTAAQIRHAIAARGHVDFGGMVDHVTGYRTPDA